MQKIFHSVQSYCVCLSFLAIFSICNANAQTFKTTGSLNQSLMCQTATPLQDGTILIAGGSNINGAYKTAEIYNPNLGAESFAPTGSMNYARGCDSYVAGQTATLLNDGTVLITGGSGNTAAELYIPSSATFSLRTQPTFQPSNPSGILIGPMTTVRYKATATLLQDGTVLIAGGDTGNNAGLTSAEIYDPIKGTFTATGSMNKPRTLHTATLLPDGTVLIAGGQGNNTTWNSAEIYHPSSKTFTLVGNMTTARDTHTATLLNNGTVLIAGGENNSATVLKSAEIYTPSTATFATTGSMAYPRIWHTSTSLANGTVLVAGGFGCCGSNASNTAEIYTPSLHTFALTGNMTVGRFSFSATTVYDGDILMAGGADYNGSESEFLQSAELYAYPVTAVYMYPDWRVTSIIYAAPGNKSQDGYTDTSTNATTTTIGSSFTMGSTISSAFGFNFNYPGLGNIGVSASDSITTSSTSTNAAAFQETFSNATGVANQSNSNASDAINHNQDLFLIWLDPLITAFGNESAEGPLGYTVGIQPTANGTIPLPDIVEVYAQAMEANPANPQTGTLAGASIVPASILNQIPTTSGQYVPGLAALCKNLITAEYNAGTCTLIDQCGCTPADFLPILQTDALLFYNGLTSSINPYPATASPLDANISSSEICGTLPPTVGSNCRYVPVPYEFGATLQEGVTLEGPNTPGGNNPINNFQQGENTQTTYTLGGQTSTQVSQSTSINIGVITGPCQGGTGWDGCTPSNDNGFPKGTGTGTTQWGVSSTMIWTDMQSVGHASGSGVNLSVSLSSSTVGCAQENNIGVFEDTIYHTFVFQQPSTDPSTCTTLAPTFYITSVLSNPAQTTLALGGSISYTIDVSAWYGFTGKVTLSVSGLPTGVTASFSPTSVTGSGTSTLKLTAANSKTTFIGTTPITVTGTSGSTTASARFLLTTVQ